MNNKFLYSLWAFALLAIILASISAYHKDVVVERYNNKWKHYDDSINLSKQDHLLLILHDYEKQNNAK